MLDQIAEPMSYKHLILLPGSFSRFSSNSLFHKNTQANVLVFSLGSHCLYLFAFLCVCCHTDYRLHVWISKWDAWSIYWNKTCLYMSKCLLERHESAKVVMCKDLIKETTRSSYQVLGYNNLTKKFYYLALHLAWSTHAMTWLLYLLYYNG